MARDPTRRFSDRVATYVRARPDYPDGVLDVLGPPGVIADVGAGTGILSRLLLSGGWTVRGVEPNAEMAAAAQAEHGYHPRWTLHAGRAEATGLGSASVDCITAGQAFHWFEPAPTRAEWVRILRPGGRVALVWNDRDPTTSRMLRDYEALVGEFGTDHEAVDHRRFDGPVLDAFFLGPWETRVLPHVHRLDRAGLRDRVLSCSYIPGPDSPGHDALLLATERLFRDHQRDGWVAMPYRTRVCLGLLPALP